MINRNARALLAAMVVGLTLSVALSFAGPVSAGAAPSTLHYFQKSTFEAITTATGSRRMPRSWPGRSVTN